MCLKTSFIFLFLCLFLHERSPPTSALTTSISHKKSQPYKIFKFKNQIPDDIGKKTEATKGGSSNEESSLQKALQHVTKSKGSRWPHLNVGDMVQQTSIFKEIDLSETDYQPPHRKSPIHNK